MKKTKKLLSLLLAVVLAMSCFTAAVAFGSDSVAINETNFPDKNFRDYITEAYDLDNSGDLSEAERSVTLMSVTEENEIKDLQGVEYFTSLKVLRCGNIGLEKLDVSALTNLTSLTCMGNSLTSLDLSKNNSLTMINCSDNEISQLSFYSQNLKTLYCQANKLTELSVFKAAELQRLRCDQNELSSLDLLQNAKLEMLNCSNNHLTDLDLSKNTLLTDVTNYMMGNQTLTLEAKAEGNLIVIPFTNHNLTNDNYVSCSLDDYGNGSGFSLKEFMANDISEISDGITYYTSTGLDGAENMQVDITVTRDFSQVDFYSDEEMTTQIGKSFAEKGGAAEAPSVTDIPSCKAFDSWSGDIENVTQDMKVYPIWKDSHDYALSAFSDDTATVSCKNCGDSFNLSYIAAVNSSKGDENYSSYLDITGDGVINAKDYSQLNKLAN